MRAEHRHPNHGQQRSEEKDEGVGEDGVGGVWLYKGWFR